MQQISQHDITFNLLV